MAKYDIPRGLFDKKRSEAFRQFYHSWFEDTWALSRGDVSTGFLNDLTLEERELAAALLRRNLRLGYAHIAEGLALLGDRESIPLLKEMFAETTDASRRLTIAGSLWKLDRDECFAEEIERMIHSGNGPLKEAHFEQILWLNDERSIMYLIDLIAGGDTFSSSLALSRLNEIEDNKRYLLKRDEFPHQPDYYLNRRLDRPFIQSMATMLKDYNPTVFVMSTTDGIVKKEIQPEH